MHQTKFLGKNPIRRVFPNLVTYVPYSRKYWQELNLAIEPKIAIVRILAEFNLVVQYWIAIRIYASRKYWQILNLQL